MSKEILIKTILHEKTDRAPWVPFAGIHSGKFLNYTAKELLTDGDKLFKSLLEVNKIYRPDGQPVVFDLQIEAEILGCNLIWAEDTPPTVSSHPLSEDKTIPCMCKMPTPKDGRLPMILDVMKKMKSAVGDTTALYGLICGPFTLASHLRGTDLFMDMFDEPEYVLDLLKFCNEFAKKMTDMFIEAGMDIVAVVDPMVSLISSDHFEEFLSESFSDLFAYIKSKGVFSSFFVCGDATKNIEVMCKTAPDCISIDENINICEAKKITDKYNIVIGGNIPLTTVMLHGSQQANMKYVIDMLDTVPDYRTNFIVSPGCDMPYAVPLENGIGVAQAVIDTETVRDVVKDFEGEDYSAYNIELPDYANLKRPFIEAFTLDSSSCAACTYMMALVNEAKERYGDKIDIIEYKFTIKDNIARCVKMGVKNLPSLYINGKLAYSSIIPSIAEISKIIDELLK